MKEIKIPAPLFEDAGAGKRAYAGYYAETVTAKVLAEQIAAAGGRLAGTSAVATFEEKVNISLQKAREAKVSNAEITRAENGARAIALQIWKDIADKVIDFPTIEFGVILSGNIEKGQSTSDLVLRMSKDSSEEVLSTLAFSLKVYKKASINLQNTTFISFIKRLFYDATDPIHFRSVKVEEVVQKFIEDYGTDTGGYLEDLAGYQRFIKKAMERGLTKKQARVQAKATHSEVIDIIIKIFNEQYTSTRKPLINARLLKMLGFDGANDFYAAIGTRGVPRVISSRQSEEFKKLLLAFQSSFTISLTHPEDTKFVSVTVTDDNSGEVLLTGTLTFADTGGDNPSGKINFFVDFNPFLPK